VRAIGAIDKKWLAANSAKGAHRGIHTAGNSPPGAREEVA
jgi:hypothetical protein